MHGWVTTLIWLYIVVSLAFLVLVRFRLIAMGDLLLRHRHRR